MNIHCMIILIQNVIKTKKMETIKEPNRTLDYPRIIATEAFIKKNNFKLKPQEEIASRFNDAVANPQFMDFRTEVLLDYLSLANAKPHLKDEYVTEIESGAKEWKQIVSIEEAAQDFLDYMNFAWGKAEDQRGLSASRSIQKLSVWLWLVSREDLCSVIENDDLYNPYGSPALIEVCNMLGIEVPNSVIEFSKVKC